MKPDYVCADLNPPLVQTANIKLQECSAHAYKVTTLHYKQKSVFHIAAFSEENWS